MNYKEQLYIAYKQMDWETIDKLEKMPEYKDLCGCFKHKDGDERQKPTICESCYAEFEEEDFDKIKNKDGFIRGYN